MDKTPRFENPANGHVESLEHCTLWAFLFGPFYFFYKGAMMPALVWLVASFFTAGLFWLFAFLFAEPVLRRYYLHAGWKELEPEAKAERSEKPKRSAAQEAEHQRKLAAAAKRTFGK